jgi:hypothetical protein
MQRLHAQIRYAYKELPGVRIRIITSDRKTLAVVHAFLQFQRREHGCRWPKRRRRGARASGRM